MNIPFLEGKEGETERKEKEMRESEKEEEALCYEATLQWLLSSISGKILPIFQLAIQMMIPLQSLP